MLAVKTILTIAKSLEFMCAKVTLGHLLVTLHKLVMTEPLVAQ